MKKLIALSIIILLALSVMGCMKYNHYVVSEAIEPGASVGILAYEYKNRYVDPYSKQKFRSVFVQQNFVSDLAQNSVQLFAGAGYDVKIVNMNFFTLTHKYPALGHLIAEKLQAKAHVDFDELLDRSYEKITDFEYDVRIKKDLNRVKEELGLKYLIIMTKQDKNPITYKAIGINLVEYAFVYNQDMRRNMVFGRWLARLFNPNFELNRMRENIRVMVGTVGAKGQNSEE